MIEFKYWAPLLHIGKKESDKIIALPSKGINSGTAVGIDEHINCTDSACSDNINDWHPISVHTDTTSDFSVNSDKCEDTTERKQSIPGQLVQCSNNINLVRKKCHNSTVHEEEAKHFQQESFTLEGNSREGASQALRFRFMSPNMPRTLKKILKSVCPVERANDEVRKTKCEINFTYPVTTSNCATIWGQVEQY